MSPKIIRRASRVIATATGLMLVQTGSFLSRNRNNPKDYAKAGFIDKVKGERVAFRNRGKNRGLFKNITVGQAKWLGKLLSRLSDRQIGDAFRAANYSTAEVGILTGAVRRRINELIELPGPGLASLGTETNINE